MRLSDLLLVLTDLKGVKGWQGRTRMQKEVYFLRRPLELAIPYQPHYYGPYSEEVAATTRSLVARGLLEEKPGSGRPEQPTRQRRYRYSLTEDGRELAGMWKEKHAEELGKLKEALAMLELERESTFVLAVASKVHYIVASSKQPVPKKELTDRASKLGWHVKRADSEKAVQFLRDRKLVAIV